MGKYLALPPGYRFLIDENGYEDVWQDNERERFYYECLRTVYVPKEENEIIIIRYVALLLIVALSGCSDIEADIYELEKIEAIVTDNVTGEPLMGVSVLAIWRLYGAHSFGFHSAGWSTIYMAESITDSDGYFEIVPPKRIKGLDGANWRMADHTPSVSIFHEGYLPKSLGNSENPAVTVRREFGWFGYKTIGKMAFSFSDGVAIALDPMELDSEEYVRYVRVRRDNLKRLRCVAMDIPIYRRRIVEAYKNGMSVRTKYDKQFNIRHKLGKLNCDGVDLDV